MLELDAPITHTITINMSYYDFLCTIVGELNDKADDLILEDFDAAEQLSAQSYLVWDKASKAALYNA